MTDSDNQNKYKLAYEEWENRIGSASIQLKNWRLACIVSLLFSVLLAIIIIIQLSNDNRFVYIAQVATGDRVTNVKEVTSRYSPTEAQKGAFLAQFVKNIMTIPLDPVVLRTNWKKAYEFVGYKAFQQLNSFALKYNAFSNISNFTTSVHVDKISPMGNNSYDLTWVVTKINKSGKTVNVTIYNGIFTFIKSKNPKTLQDMIINPTGLQIGYFSFNKKGSSQ